MEKFTTFCKDLYPNNENLQTETFGEFVRKIDKNSLENNKLILKDFIQNLRNDDWALEALNAVNNKILLAPLDILEIANNRLSHKYESIATLLNKKTLQESLSEEGLKNVKELLFANDGELPTNISLASLFSYYDIKKEDPKIFKSLLKSEVLQELAVNFSPSSKTAYLTAEEFKKMTDVFNDPENHEANLTSPPSIEILSNYLKNKAGSINNLPVEEIDDYKFGKSETSKDISEDQDLTNQFKALLQKPSPSNKEEGVAFDKEVAAFFEKVLDLNGEINYHTLNGRTSLGTFFERDKYLLARLLQQDGGFDKFDFAFRSGADGCFANIGTQARIALCQSFFTDTCDQALFSTFTKISGLIINKNAVDHHSEGGKATEIFNSYQVNRQFISPAGFAKELISEFCDGGKKIRDSWDVIEQNLDGETRLALYNTFESLHKAHNYFQETNARGNNAEEAVEELQKIADKKSVTAIQEEAAKIAAYLTIKTTLPDLFNSKYLQKFRTECEVAIRNAEQMQNVVEASEETTEDAVKESLSKIKKISPLPLGNSKPSFADKLRIKTNDQKTTISRTEKRITSAITEANNLPSTSINSQTLSPLSKGNNMGNPPISVR